MCYCLLQIGDARPLFDLMAITLEKLPSGVGSRATIGSLMILAHVISVASASSRSQQVRRGKSFNIVSRLLMSNLMTSDCIF